MFRNTRVTYSINGELPDEMTAYGASPLQLSPSL
jgi:hypothetical protein